MYILLYIFLLVTCIQLLFILIPFRKLAFYSRAKATNKPFSKPVSVVICAHNEAENLTAHLSHVLNQQYPNFEVLVINDYSTDNTWQVLESFAKQYPHLRIIQATHDKTTGNKKLALAEAVSHTSFDYLLLTDADCKPLSTAWIQQMMNCYTDTTDMVLGYSPYTTKPGLLNQIIRFETFYTAIQYLSLAISGMPYMGVGRNLSYKKTAFTSSQALKVHDKTLSGDDDLVVNDIAQAHNVNICLHPQSFVESVPAKSIKNWLHQKHRHTQSGNLYKKKHRTVLAALYITHILFYGLFIVLVGTGFSLQVVGSVFLAKLIVESIVYYKLMRRLNMIDLFPFLLAHNFILSLILVTLGFLSRIKVNVWRITQQVHHQEHRQTLNWSNKP